MSFHVWIAPDRPQLTALVAGAARQRLGPDLHPGALLVVSPPWVPADLVRSGPPRPVLRTATLDSLDHRGRVLTDRGYRDGARAPDSPLRRGADFLPEELVSPRLSRILGGVLALAHADQPPMAYAAHHVGGRCRWSVFLREGERLARYDGHGVGEIDLSGGLEYAEGDRAGVLLAGLSRLVGAPLRPGDDERLTLADHIGWGPEEGEALRLVP